MMKLMKHIAIALIASLGVTLSSCSDDDPQPIKYTTAEAYLEAIGFTGSALIRKGNTDIVRKGFGMADIVNDIPNDPSLIYRIGSITKSFTAAAIVHLKRDGLIESFDQTLDEFDDDFPHGDQITIHHLMTHHSGIPDYVGPVVAYANANNYYFELDEIYDVITESIEKDGLEFTPEKFFSYSNSNYFILGMLIEELTGKTFQEYLADKIYEPLSLIETGKGPDEIIGSQRAKGYHKKQEVDLYQMQIAFSAGQIESTISDLEKWGDAIMADYFTEEEKPSILAPAIGQDGVNAPGAGWFTLDFDDQVIYHHGGDIDGFTSLIVLIPESNGLIILLSNEQDKGAERYQIMEEVMKNEF